MPVIRILPEGATSEDRHYLTIDPLLSEDECRQWIDFAEALGFDEAPINLGGGREARVPEVRNNRRAMIDAPDRATELWARTEPLLPGLALRWRGRPAIGFNERLRFYRYDPGQRFALHGDGHFRRPDHSEVSRRSFLIYLNGDFEGGATIMYQLGIVTPGPGLALCFEHPLLHEGQEVRSGVKYVLRTDIMYSLQ